MNLRTRAIVLALALPLSTGLLAGCGEDDAEPTAADPSDPPSSAPSDPPSTSESEPASEPPSEPVEGEAVPLYFTGESPFGVRLYREFREVESDNPLEEAAAMLVAGDALDPDYGTLLSGVTVAGVEQEDGAIVVTLAEDSVTSAESRSRPATPRSPSSPSSTRSRASPRRVIRCASSWPTARPPTCSTSPRRRG